MTAADLYRLRVRCAASRDIPSADVIALLDQYALLDAAAERDELAAKVARARALVADFLRGFGYGESDARDLLARLDAAGGAK